jgi:hypothetical protein
VYVNEIIHILEEFPVDFAWKYLLAVLTKDMDFTQKKSMLFVGQHSIVSML